MKVVAISACLIGQNCRYNAEIKRDDELLSLLEGSKLIPFCPEDSCFGTPRESMDLVELSSSRIRAISNETQEDLTDPILTYAKDFFKKHQNIDLYIGKDRSPSCGVASSRLYNLNAELISATTAGIMSEVALKNVNIALDAEVFKENY